MRHRSIIVGVAAVLIVLAACSSDDTSSSDTSSGATTAAVDATTTSGDLPSCDDAQFAVVTDIDNTLTVSNAEILTQLGDSTYDPEERPGAAEVFQAYADNGYQVVYITARAETLSAADSGTPARQLTESWLDAHGFPEGPVFLAASLDETADAAPYKSAVVADLEADGMQVVAAYGDAVTDFEAWATVPVPEESNFSLGEEAGYEGTTSIEEVGYEGHLDDLDLAPVCAP